MLCTMEKNECINDEVEMKGEVIDLSKEDVDDDVFMKIHEPNIEIKEDDEEDVYLSIDNANEILEVSIEESVKTENSILRTHLELPTKSTVNKINLKNYQTAITQNTSEIKEAIISGTPKNYYTFDALLFKSLIRECNRPEESSKRPFYVCKECHCKHSDRTKMIQHLAKNHKISLFVCKVCEKRYTTAKESILHIKSTHIGKLKPHKCHWCNHRSEYKCSLMKHVALHHTHDEPIECDQCPYGICAQSQYITHLTEEQHNKTDIINHVLSSMLPLV